PNQHPLTPLTSRFPVPILRKIFRGIGGALMRKLLFSAAAALLLAGTVRADLITLGTDHSSGNPLFVSTGSVSGPMLVNILNNTDTDTTDNLMVAWQFNLMIVAH